MRERATLRPEGGVRCRIHRWRTAVMIVPLAVFTAVVAIAVADQLDPLAAVFIVGLVATTVGVGVLAVRSHAVVTADGELVIAYLGAPGRPLPLGDVSAIHRRRGWEGQRGPDALHLVHGDGETQLPLGRWRDEELLLRHLRHHLPRVEVDPDRVEANRRGEDAGEPDTVFVTADAAQVLTAPVDPGSVAAAERAARRRTLSAWVGAAAALAVVLVVSVVIALVVG